MGKTESRAYCLHCKADRPVVGARQERLKTGRPVERGTCAECGTATSKLLKAATTT